MSSTKNRVPQGLQMKNEGIEREERIIRFVLKFSSYRFLLISSIQNSEAYDVASVSPLSFWLSALLNSTTLRHSKNTRNPVEIHFPPAIHHNRPVQPSEFYVCLATTCKRPPGRYVGNFGDRESGLG